MLGGRKLPTVIGRVVKSPCYLCVVAALQTPCLLPTTQCPDACFSIT